MSEKLGVRMRHRGIDDQKPPNYRTGTRHATQAQKCQQGMSTGYKGTTIMGLLSG